MSAFGTYARMLAARVSDAIASARKTPQPALDGVPRTITQSVDAADPRCRVTRRSRHGIDAFYFLTLVASLAGFSLIGNDLVAVRRDRDERSTATPTMRRADVFPSIKTGDSDRLPRVPGSFPAPSQAKAWAEALAACARPGTQVGRLVDSFEGTPAQRIAQVYLWTARHWKYQADRDQDWLTPAEKLLESGTLFGDCKAIAVLLAAGSTQLGIVNRIVATRGLDGGTGHVQTQILLCRPGEDPTPVVDTMTAVWNSLGQTPDDGKADLPLVLTTQGWYLALDGGPPPRRIDRLGPVEVIVSSASRTDK